MEQSKGITPDEVAQFRQGIRSLLGQRIRDAVEIVLEEELSGISEAEAIVTEGEEEEEDRSRDGWTVSTDTREPSRQQKMKTITELDGGELCMRSHTTVTLERLEEET